jgi:hypothetical protein
LPQPTEREGYDYEKDDHIPLCLFFTFYLSLGCSSGLINKSELLRNQLEFLSIGKTFEQEVLTQLGEPEDQHEGGTVLTYELREDTNHRLHLADKKSQSGDGFVWRPTPLKPDTYHLSLVFQDTSHG